MDTQTAIFTRRSVRAYTGVPVSDDDLHDILRAGFSAPTCANFRPWQFVVVRERATLEAVCRVQGSRFMLQAGCGIVVCGDKTIHENEYYLNQDCCAAIENMLLLAHGLGLGGLWMGLNPHEEKAEHLRRVLQLPDEVLPMAFLAIGEPAEHREAQDRYNAERVHFDHW